MKTPKELKSYYFIITPAIDNAHVFSLLEEPYNQVCNMIVIKTSARTRELHFY